MGWEDRAGARLDAPGRAEPGPVAPAIGGAASTRTAIRSTGFHGVARHLRRLFRPAAVDAIARALHDRDDGVC